MKDPRISRAIDTNLSGLRLSAYRQEEIMQKIYGGSPVKKKLSFSLVLALVLLVVTVAAVAAVLLGGKDLVDQVIQPLAEKTDSQRFSKEEVEEILAFAQKQGIQLDEESLKAVRKQGDYFKEELAMLFAKTELGFYPSTWSVADQHWFGEFRKSIGDIGINNSTIPAEGELSQEEIEAIAVQYIHERAGDSYPLNDPEHYTLHRSFGQTRLNPYQYLREWTLDYEPMSPRQPRFSLRLSPTGQVKQYGDNVLYLQDISSLDADSQLQLVYDEYSNRYSDRYGSLDSFSQENWQAMHQDALQVAGKPEREGSIMAYVQEQGYGPLPEGAITREKAIQIAADQVSKRYQVDPDKLLKEPEDRSGWGKFIHAIYLSYGEHMRWKVSFERDYLAEIDAMTGEARVVDQYSPGNSYFRRYVLDGLLPQEKRAHATQRPPLATWAPGLAATPYPQPLDLDAPQAYWDALQAIGYNGDTASLIYDKLYLDYGEDKRFWPLDMQALDQFRFGRPTQEEAQDSPGFAGIPLPGDISPEEATEVAWAEMKSGAHGLYEPDFIAALMPAVSYSYNAFGQGSHSYAIAFVDVSGDLPKDIATVYVNALTSAVIKPTWAGVSIGNIRFDEYTFTKARLGEDGRPLIWGHRDLPQYYWDIMDKRQDSYEGVISLLAKAQQEYGPLNFFWPLMEKSLYDLWTIEEPYQGEYGLILSGLPAEDDISQEKALELAWAAFRKLSAAMYTEEDYQHVKPVIGFVYNRFKAGDRSWNFEFVDTRVPGYHTLGMVLLDAVTGEVQEISVERGNG